MADEQIWMRPRKKPRPVLPRRRRRRFTPPMWATGHPASSRITFASAFAATITAASGIAFASSFQSTPMATGGVAFASAFSPASWYVAPTSAVLFASAFRVVQGDLASGRYRR